MPTWRYAIGMFGLSIPINTVRVTTLLFYVDILGHRDDENVATALDELRAQAAFYKVVGSYPRAIDEGGQPGG